ncbi:ranBP-type and C3HC4-type zinc finger-containing protein 1-like [Micropterus dolomieu]|uniref:ranBP-type and C3HC4-type zinc finger-containing protein 1-like n=1 Tax=Micropterus dolomieu TaxID=147949 RepID=UPI001E8D95F7|nr:ranBP-type and C3HC4-type zinc finger-containing protein 1-like [Micropterus dolomieu]XP_045884532.1 ranBP-type and C3HC4-type zinc finger-containing protein 1-like [Micropterus dolomieu]
MASEVTPGVNLKEAEELALSLSEALSSGDGQEAVRLCQKLSQLYVPVSVSINSQAYPQDSIRLWVGVEDGQSDTYIPVTIVVSCDMTIAQLKEKISHDFGFSPTLQRWVIGKRLAQDRETLYSHGVRQSGDKAFLFILSAHAAHLTRQQHKLDQEQQRIEGIVESMESMQLLPRGLGGGGGEKTAPPPDTEQAPPPPLLPKPPTRTKPAVLPKPQLGWACAMCTFVNKPTRPGCEMCGGDRPEDYEVPNIYQPDQEEVLRIQQEQLAMLQYEQAQKEERERNYLYLLATEDQNLILNTTETDCPICFSTLLPEEGVVLRECLHTFCRECLKGTIVNSQDAEVSCPDKCESKLLDREIQALLTEEEHQRFLELRLSIAESRSEHSFHCQTPNCRGWCIYEDEVNEFHCELCDETNCILCRAIHNGMNCKDYQDDLRIRAENDQAAQQTKQMLENLLQNGEAMKCPRCDIIVQKKDGCDWICCLMCRTEICWVTKQARWGPNGSGDISGGCKCRVNNQPCHPNCQNCH